MGSFSAVAADSRIIAIDSFADIVVDECQKLLLNLIVLTLRKE